MGNSADDKIMERPTIPGMGKAGDVGASWEPIDAIRPWLENPRVNDHAVPFVVASMKAYGFGAPIIVRRDGEIIAGHTRLKAAIEIGLDAVLVRRMPWLSDAEAHELALADNKLGEKAKWDPAGVLAIIKDLDERRRQQIGFEERDIADLLRRLPRRGRPADDAPDPPAVPKTRRGDIIVLGRHRLMCGDSCSSSDVAELFEGAHARWMWTDPPYGVEIAGGDQSSSEKDRRKRGGLTIKNDGVDDLPRIIPESFARADSVLLPGAPIYVAHPQGANAWVFLKNFIEVGWHIHETIIWAKDSMVLGHSDYHYQHEPILYGWKRGANRTWFGGRSKTSMLHFDRPKRSEVHPTMKPIDLVIECLTNSAAPESLGYEPFGGSGTSLLSAEHLGLSCYAMEIDPRYCDVIVQRWEEATGERAVRPVHS